jgi:hypothetical protein
MVVICEMQGHVETMLLKKLRKLPTSEQTLTTTFQSLYYVLITKHVEMLVSYITLCEIVLNSSLI